MVLIDITWYMTVRFRLPLNFLLLLLLPLHSEVGGDESGDIRAQVPHDWSTRNDAVSQSSSTEALPSPLLAA